MRTVVGVSSRQGSTISSKTLLFSLPLTKCFRLTRFFSCNTFIYKSEKQNPTESNNSVQPKSRL